MTRLRRRWPLVAFAAFAFAAAYPMQVNGWNQNAHYALVRALAQGTPTIDRTRHEIGELGTGDVTLVDGHYYSNKAPGLAMTALPAFLVLDAVGMRTTGDPTRVIWALHLWSIVVAAVVLIVLVRRYGDALEPGHGAIGALTLGIATLVLPFSTLFFSHVLAAALGFAAFFVLRPGRPASPARAFAAGVLLGFGMVVEYPVALVALALWLAVLAYPGRPRRAIAYTAGFLLGVAPLALYNLWAFGSLTHVSYEENQVEPIGGFFGVAVPSPGVAFDLLFSAWGLLVNMPVAALGLAGGVLLYRLGRRIEALVLLAVPALGFVHDSALQFSPFGGLGPPRYLIYTLPFALAPVALVYRRLPLTTASLAVVSACTMVVTTATNPLAAYDLDWVSRISGRHFSQTGAAFVDVTGWYTIALFFAAVAIAVGAAAAATPWRRSDARDAVVAMSAVLAWALVASLAETPRDGAALPTAYVLAVAAAGSLVVLAAALRPTPSSRPVTS